MNPQEREQLQLFLKQLTQANIAQKDSEAEQFIKQAVNQQPDAHYLLVQRAMLLEQAVNNANRQIADLQRQLQNQPNQNTGFLNQDPWAQPNTPNPYQPPRYAPPVAAAPNASFLSGSGFLGSVASTAAGVVAGSFLFQGIENLLGHHGGGNSWQNSALGGHDAGEQISEQTIINNYYGDDAMTQQVSADPFDTTNYEPDASNTLDDSDPDWI